MKILNFSELSKTSYICIHEKIHNQISYPIIVESGLIIKPINNIYHLGISDNLK